MISNNLAKNALAVAQQLSEIGVELSPKNNSILAELQEAAVPMNFVQPGQREVTILPGGRVQQDNYSTWTLTSPDDFANAIVNATGNNDDTSIHTLRISALADDLAPLVKSHLYTARSVVIPLVAKFEEDAKKYLDLAATANPASDFKIDILRIPALLGDESFNAMGLDQVTNLNEVAGSVRRYTVKIDDVDQAVAEICNLGNDRLNGLVADWLEYAPEGLIKNTLLANFTALSNFDEVGRFIFDQYTLRRGNQGFSMHVSLATWLIANWLKTNVKSTVENATADEYAASFQFCMDVAGVTLKAALDALGRQIQTGVLVTALIPSAKEIMVHERLYREYLEKGGKAEALFGMLVSNNFNYAMNMILEDQANLIAAWNSYLGFRGTKALSDIRSGFQAWVRSYMAVSISELTELEAEFEKTECPNLKEQIMKNVDAEIMHLSHRLHEDIAHTALHMVAKARFYYTSAYQLLSEMQQVARMNPEIDPREAATAAAITYLVEYQYSQANIVSMLK